MSSKKSFGLWDVLVYNELVIHFIWASKYPLIPGTGGSEVYTTGQMRELMSRGIDCDVITVNTYGKKDGRKFYPDLKFCDLTGEDLADLDGTCIFVNLPPPISKTKNQSYVILHGPPPRLEEERAMHVAAVKGKKILVSSYAAAEAWGNYFGIMRSEISVVYPFADELFGKLKRTKNKRPVIVYAGRLTPNKGIYLLLAAMHDKRMVNYNFKIVAASKHTTDGKIIYKMLKVHPNIKLIEPLTHPKKMAELLVKCDVLVMPTSASLFMETFGMLSIEAQHAGCRVVASNCGGLPETQVGGLILIEPENPVALADGIVEAASMGHLTNQQRKKIEKFFTVKDSVDNLLKAIQFSA